MMHINKRYIVDERDNPKEVVILLGDHRKIEELLGLDMDDEGVRQLLEARQDRESGNKYAYVSGDGQCTIL
ncbi:MAG: hypothetical protein JRF56_01725 [Deltaproteobacteria bacterium]|nr:hypothetical protein [Deltaproteobacteria bacterium]